jgi:hypothetical protein
VRVVGGRAAAARKGTASGVMIGVDEALRRIAAVA